jgi:steroid delta-isomerase-like uncharacterized protein
MRSGAASASPAGRGRCPTSVEQNQAVVRRFFEELWSRPDRALAEALFAGDCLTHQLRGGAWSVAERGPASMTEHIEEWHAALPDLRAAVEELYGEGDHVFVRWVIRGTQSGPLFGVPPTGNRLEIHGCASYELRGGRIVADWVLFDQLGLFQQLGLLPPTEHLLRPATTTPNRP